MNKVHIKKLCAWKGESTRQNSDVHGAKEWGTRESSTERAINYFLLSYEQFELL